MRIRYGCFLPNLTEFTGEPPTTSKAHYGAKKARLQAIIVPKANLCSQGAGGNC